MKNGLRLAAVLIVIGFLSSCVGNRKLVYLQDKEAKGVERYSPELSLKHGVSNYLLAPGDVLYVRMQKFVVGEELFRISGFEQSTRIGQMQHPYLQGYTINDSGLVELPLIGSVEVSGRTISEVRDEINRKAQSQFPGSNAEVFLLDGTVSILGQVKYPGRYPIYKFQNSIFDILASAGDLGDYADREHIRIVRIVGGETKVFDIDLTQKGAIAEDVFCLQNNDLIIVNPLKRRQFVTANIQWLVSGITAIVSVASLVISVSR